MATSSTRRSIVQRLTARAAVWAVVIAITLGSVALWQFRRASLRALDAQLRADAETLARAIVVDEELLEVDASADMRAALAAADRYYGVYDAEGRPVDGDAPALQRGRPPEPGLITRGAFREAWVAGPRGARVRVARPLSSIDADMWRLAASLLVASLVTLLFAAPLTVWLRRALAQALTQFDRTAKALSPGRPARIDLARLDVELVGVAGRLNEAFDRLEAGLQRERQLTADASHELRTPVSTILAETEWALGRERSGDEYRQALDVCRRQGRRLKALIETLLVLARIESGAVPPTETPVALGALIDAAIGDVAAPASTRRLRVWRDGDATVDGDAMQLGILLANLLSNAVRYTRDDGEVEVRVAAQDDGMVRVAVRDTGPGLGPGAAERVFDRFWRADPSRSSHHGGTGLGLAISKAIVESHGGTIACESSTAGATFIVRLPRQRSPALA